MKPYRVWIQRPPDHSIADTPTFGYAYGNFRAINSTIHFEEAFRMRRLISVSLLLLFCLPAFAQEHSHTQNRPVTLVSGLGNLHHPVSTKNADAQKFFDQGLRFIYAFNHDEAARSFGQATKLDPKLAIAH